MQIDQIRVTDIFKNEKAGDTEGITSGTNIQKKENETVDILRNIKMDSPFYSRKTIGGDTVADRLEKDLQRGAGAEEMTNQLAVYANTTSASDLQKMQEEGFDPMSTDVHTMVTVVDRIKMALAKGGADISSMGGLSDAKIEAMTGDAALATQIKGQLEDLGISVDDTLTGEIETAVCKAEELQNPMTEDSVKYLMTNEMEPTIDNIYQASFAAGSAEFAEEKTDAFVPTQEMPSDMVEQVAFVITDAGLEESKEVIQDCQWMMEHDIPVTAEDLNYFEKLKDLDLDLSQDKIAEVIVDAVTEGKQPGDAALIPEYSLMAQAKTIYEKQQAEITNITATRQREEARMMMSVQANYTLLKKGVALDTMSIQEVIEELKELEKSYLEETLAGETPEETDENIRTYESFTGQLNEFKATPAAVLGHVEDISEMTLPQLRERGTLWKDTFEKANERYETLWTAPRKDMGDSIQKAFVNVDEILKDLQLEVSDANRRAVRILSYNQMELTPENIATVKSSDAAVQRMFKALTPATVTAMIKTGKNPLDMKVGELTDTAENMANEQNEFAAEDQYAKFLWKMERTGDITPEERESFIGVYRLIHQVEAGDGAAIGALLAQGTEVTLRNLMTAVRSGKHTGKEFTVDDSFGEVESFDKSSLSITEQIEMAFQTNCLHEAGEKMTPVKMKQFDGEASYMDLSPEQFKEELTLMEQEPVAAEEVKQEKAYAEEVRQEVAKALASEKQVFEILERYDLPKTPAFLSGISEMLRERNSVYRNLLKYGKSEDPEEVGIEALIQELIEDYGEAVKTPKEMADAQRKLEETAENVMKNMLVEKDVSSIDVRGMKLVMTQIRAIGQMAEQSETYHIPILVEDQVGNLSLKIVRGSEEKGLVDIVMDTDETGTVYGSFRYEAGEVTGDVSFERQEVQNIFAEHMQLLADAMREETDLPVSFKFAWDKQTDADEFYEDRAVDFETTKEQDAVSTKVLYGIARSFIDVMTEII